MESNNSVLTLFDVRKSDSADYVCTATNMLGEAIQRTLLLVVSLPWRRVERVKLFLAFLYEVF